MDETKKYFICGLPYQISIKEGLLSREQIEDEMSETDFDPTKFSMEMETLWFGDTDGAFFTFDLGDIKEKDMPFQKSPIDILEQQRTLALAAT